MDTLAASSSWHLLQATGTEIVPAVAEVGVVRAVPIVGVASAAVDTLVNSLTSGLHFLPPMFVLQVLDIYTLD